MQRRSKRKSPAAGSTLSLGRLEKHLGYFLRRLQVWVFQDFIATLRAMKVRPAQYSVLIVIEANPGQTQAAIGKRLNIERARLARMLHELERRKWVMRRASDGRSHSLHLTAEGEKALARIKTLADEHEAHLAALLGPARRKQMLGWLRRFG